MLIFFGNHLLFNVHFFISSQTKLNSSSKFTACTNHFKRYTMHQQFFPVHAFHQLSSNHTRHYHPKSVRWVLTVGTEFGISVPRNFVMWARARGSESYVVDVQFTFF